MEKSIRELLSERFYSEGSPRSGIELENLYTQEACTKIFCKNNACEKFAMPLDQKDLKIYLTTSRKRARTDSIVDCINSDATNVIVGCKHCGTILYKFENFKNLLHQVTQNNACFDLTNLLYEQNSIFEVTSNFLQLTIDQDPIDPEKKAFKIHSDSALNFKFYEDFWKYLKADNDTKVMFDIYSDTDLRCNFEFTSFPASGIQAPRVSNKAASASTVVLDVYQFNKQITKHLWQTITIDNTSYDKKLRVINKPRPTVEQPKVETTFAPKFKFKNSSADSEASNTVYIKNIKCIKSTGEELRLSTYFEEAEELFIQIDSQAELQKSILKILNAMPFYSNILTPPDQLDYRYAFDYRKETDANVKLYRNECSLYGTGLCPETLSDAEYFDAVRTNNAVEDGQLRADLQAELYKSVTSSVELPEFTGKDIPLELPSILKRQNTNLNKISITYPEQMTSVATSLASATYKTKPYSCVQCLNALRPGISNNCTRCEGICEAHDCGGLGLFGVHAIFKDSLNNRTRAADLCYRNITKTKNIATTDVCYKEKLPKQITYNCTPEVVEVSSLTDIESSTTEVVFNPTPAMEPVVSVNLASSNTRYVWPIEFKEAISKTGFENLTFKIKIENERLTTDSSTTVGLYAVGNKELTLQGDTATITCTQKESEGILEVSNLNYLTGTSTCKKVLIVINTNTNCMVSIKEISCIISSNPMKVDFGYFSPTTEYTNATLVVENEIEQKIILAKGNKTAVNSTVLASKPDEVESNSISIKVSLDREYPQTAIQEAFVYTRSLNGKVNFSSNGRELAYSEINEIQKIQLDINRANVNLKDFTFNVQANSDIMLDLYKVELVFSDNEINKSAGYYFTSDFADMYYSDQQIGWSLVDSTDPSYPIDHRTLPIINDTTLYAVWKES